MSTPTEIGERTLAHARSFMTEDWTGVEADAGEAFRPHIGTIAAAPPMPLRRVDVKHVWQSGPEWHVEAECAGDEGERVLMLRWLDGTPPRLVGGAVRTA